MDRAAITPFYAALQHGPRPLPLFLDMLRSETAASPDRQRAALAGLAAYQAANRGSPRRMARIVRRQGRVALRDYGGAGVPIVFVPSLINPPFILDLGPGNSLLRWLPGRLGPGGGRCLLIDWGTPDASARDLDVTAHVERLLLPLLRRLDRPPILVGYCLGGTIAAAAAARLPVAGLAMIAAPWRFGGFGSVARAQIAALWETAKPVCDAMGLVPMEVLQSGFWRIDPARTIGKYERFATLDPASRAARDFVALEDWANAGAPLLYATGRQLFEDFVADDLPGGGNWQVGGAPVDLSRIDAPAVDFVSLSDRIVPAASAAGFADRRELGAGHVGMIVGGRAREQLWEPLADWISALSGGRERAAPTEPVEEFLP